MMDFHTFSESQLSYHDLSYHCCTLKRIFCEKHKIKENSKCPNINRNTIVRIADNFRCHIFLCATMGLSSTSSNRSCKAKICNFIRHLNILFLKQDIFWFYIPVNEILLMDTFQSLHNFHHNFNCMLQWKNLTW